MMTVFPRQTFSIVKGRIYHFALGTPEQGWANLPSPRPPGDAAVNTNQIILWIGHCVRQAPAFVVLADAWPWKLIVLPTALSSKRSSRVKVTCSFRMNFMATGHWL